MNGDITLAALCTCQRAVASKFVAVRSPYGIKMWTLSANKYVVYFLVQLRCVCVLHYCFYYYCFVHINTYIIS